MKKNNRMLEGFTLVEILIVVVIIGILATIAIPTYFKYVERGYASDAKVQIKNILQNAELYRQETGQWPTDVEIMMDEGFIELKRSILNKWEFTVQLEDDDIGTSGQISATSLPAMHGGEGHQITFLVDEGEFVGYGQKRQE
ncbi:prepilin-type N-terminal cleavage/methylation domain-containing protein [Candidatus Marinimicrobia bacterium PRS2]|nr:prepilin-type N-terminal cleavage/methylation domain-containing protein [Candidatus Marinimicrobia bacterium PRS2]